MRVRPVERNRLRDYLIVGMHESVAPGFRA